LAVQAGVYKIINKVNGRFYIGSAVNIKKRWRYHIQDLNKGKHGNGYLQRAWNKYGSDNFIFEVLEYCEPSELIRMEQDYLDSTGACESGYNMCPVAGNRLGTKMPPDAVRRVAEANRGRKMSEEECRNKSLRQTGTKRSEETKKKMSEVKMGERNPMYGQHRTGKDAPRYGHHFTEETKRKMSAAQMGRKLPPFTEEHKRNMRIAFKNRPPFTEERKRKMSEAQRKIATPERRKILSLAVTEWWRKRKHDQNNLSL